jgi:uncharacterized integral membrane protein (TIGR00697 family)
VNTEARKQADFYYLLLGGLFISALITCNLIANRFIEVGLGFKTFIISAGVLPYPITFLITDILSEIYGRKKTNRVILVGFAASFFVLGILKSSMYFNAVSFSPVSDLDFDQMFGNSWRVVMASMLAYLIAQLVDVRLFHFWKDLTKKKHLWLRNNASTVFSQLVDTTLVVLVLFLGVRSNDEIFVLIVDGWLFKVLCAFIDTPFLYAATYLFRRKFKLSFGDELSY